MQVKPADPRGSHGVRTRAIIERMSTLGEILKMLPGAPVNDEVLLEAVANIQPEQRIGQALVAMRTITKEQLDRALDLQHKIRSMEDLDEVLAFFEEVRAAADQARDRLAQSSLFLAIPSSNHEKI